MLDLSSRKVYGALAEQCVGGDAKADKVETAVAGNLAGLDANGNLTDSGVSPTEDVTVEGNPVTFESPFEQDAKNVVVSVKPIQDLHGYDHPWPAGGGKNKIDISLYDSNYFSRNNETLSNIQIDSKNVLDLVLRSYSGESILDEYYLLTVSETGRFALQPVQISSGVTSIYLKHNGDTKDLSILREPWTAQGTFTLSLTVEGHDPSTVGGLVISNIQIEQGSTATDFAPYSNICPISGIDEVEIEVSDGESEPTTTTIPLPSTLYGGTVDVDTGVVTVTDGYIASYDGETLPGEWISDRDEYVAGTSPTTGAEVAYKLATPTTISFTPADVELLEGTNVVSTNGEKVAVTYGRSLWQDIDDLKTDTEGKLDKSNVADVEGDTASRAYSVNEFMLRSDGLYKVTQPIASGASITASNTTKTTIGAVLTALLNA